MFRLAQLSDGRPLQAVVLGLLRKRGLISRLDLPEDRLRSFLADVEEAYHPHNPYHNSSHAADVTQVNALPRGTAPARGQAGARAGAAKRACIVAYEPAPVRQCRSGVCCRCRAFGTMQHSSWELDKCQWHSAHCATHSCVAEQRLLGGCALHPKPQELSAPAVFAHKHSTPAPPLPCGRHMLMCRRWVLCWRQTSLRRTSATWSSWRLS